MRSSTKRHAALLATGAVVLAVTLAACGSDSGGGDDGPVTVTLWQREGGGEFHDQVAAFEKQNPDVKVKISTVAGDQYLTKLANSIRAGSVPDLISFDVVNAPLLATQGQLADITDRAKSLPDVDQLAPAGVEIGTLDGKNYALPIALTASQMFWNKELFTKAGLDPDKAPASLAEVKKDAEKIAALGGGVAGFSTLGGTGQAWTGFPSAWADGGDVFTEPGKDQKATFDDPSLVGMVSWYQDMWKSGLMQKTDEPNQDPGNVGAQNALKGKVGIIFTGANALTPKKDMFGAAPGIPGADGKLGSFLGGDEIALTAGAKHPDQAWKLATWLLSSKDAATITTAQGWVAPDLTLAKSLATDPWSKTIVDALAIGKLPKSIAYNATVNDPNGPWAQSSQKVIFQGGDAATELASAAQKADQLIQDAYSQVGQ